MLNQQIIAETLRAHPYHLFFVTVSGAHLYGFHSPDSDYDLRGSHVAPARELFRLDPPRETVDVMDKSGPIEMDLVTHDVAKFFRLLLGRNGYVLEQIFSPLVVQAAPEFEELKAIARTCITRHHRHHYRGFAENQWAMVLKNNEPTVKGLLYTYRVLLAGTHLLRTGQVEANLKILNEEARLPYIPDLIARKMSGPEKQLLQPGELERHEAEFVRLRDALEAAAEASHLPDEPAGRPALDDLLVRLRMKTLA